MQGTSTPLKYHLVWCPKYRRKVWVDEIAEELRSLLYQKAEELDVTIEALESMPDHVHLFIESDPTEAPQRLANQFKNVASKVSPTAFPSSEHVEQELLRWFDRPRF